MALLLYGGSRIGLDAVRGRQGETAAVDRTTSSSIRRGFIILARRGESRRAYLRGPVGLLIVLVYLS